MNPTQEEQWEREDLQAACRIMYKARREYNAAKDTLRELKQQTKRAESLVKQKYLQLIAAETHLGGLVEGTQDKPPARR